MKEEDKYKVLDEVFGVENIKRLPIYYQTLTPAIGLSQLPVSIKCSFHQTLMDNSIPFFKPVSKSFIININESK